jgi:hypothetical protein
MPPSAKAVEWSGIFLTSLRESLRESTPSRMVRVPMFGRGHDWIEREGPEGQTVRLSDDENFRERKSRSARSIRGSQS